MELTSLPRFWQCQKGEGDAAIFPIECISLLPSKEPQSCAMKAG